AVVTGAARGIGRALAQGLLEAGARLVAADRAWAGAEATRREFEESGRAFVVGFDINDAEAVAIARDRALDRFGRVDILVNNAALRMRALFPPAGLSTVLDTTDSDWDAMLRVIVLGTLTATRAFVPAMRVSGQGGSIVMVGSAGSLPVAHDGDGTWRAQRVAPKNQPYDAAKAALASLSFSLAGELKADGIAVNLVWPGGTMTTGSAEMRDARIAAGVDTGRFLRPEHVVPPVLHLAKQRGPDAVTATALNAPLWNARHGFGERDKWVA
ncbi:MAG TPA: SDR family oxidoreductase, partial [Stellaceae bacterium]|nr:SDR family oxidoreductase [Stellaceae bacterium]